ncbi:hypothetical protein ABIE64_003826 [Thalassospira sp. MBR-102]|uniref:hypothetical protein n=1 Tax=Thalassospira sp. MBR-102 TaxID=3156466 RepID=UPI00339AE5F2
MAKIGNFFIAGDDGFDGIYKSGVSYSLTSASPVSTIFHIPDSEWIVEVQSSSKYIVARTTSRLSHSEVQSFGLKHIQQFLDILSVQGIMSTTVNAPATSNICVHTKDEQTILTTYNQFPMPMGINVEIQHTDSEGNLVPPTPEPVPVWNESFRYYRLSQCSDDSFEAYRNLFLAFEAQLNNLHPKKNNEGERKWLERALTMIHKNISLTEFVPKGESPVKYIVKTQYQDVRCKLQHAKFPKSHLPHSSLSPTLVKNAYGQLLRIWRKISGSFFNIKTSGGVITYQGFAIMMKNALTAGVSTHYTSDPTPIDKTDTLVSPRGKVTAQFNTSSYLGEVDLGVVRIKSSEETEIVINSLASPIFRVCIVLQSTLLAVSYLKDGLEISGVDCWENVADLILVNSQQPKDYFAT